MSKIKLKKRLNTPRINAGSNTRSPITAIIRTIDENTAKRTDGMKSESRYKDIPELMIKVVWRIAPALCFGNCVVFKPAELVPSSAWALADIIYQRFPVPLNWDNTRYPRLIFICPCCVKKRLNLYGAKNGCACRECLGLHYRCQSEAPLERLTRATIKQRKQIWGDKAEQDLLSYSCPIKPKGRHSIKFARDYQRLDKVEVQRFELLRTYLKSIKSNLDYGLGIMV